jgi:hypothetical protein
VQVKSECWERWGSRNSILTYDLRNCKIIYLFCVKSQNLWALSSAPQALESNKPGWGVQLCNLVARIYPVFICKMEVMTQT